MSQSDYNIANADGATVRADINSQLDAIGSQNSGSTAPPVTFPFMRWFDTANQQLKERNGANTAWRIVAEVVDGELVPYSAGQSADARYARLAGANEFDTLPTVDGEKLATEQFATAGIAAKLEAGDVLGGTAQIWQDVTGSRTAGVTYTNSTGRPIMVSVDLASTSANGVGVDSEFFVDSVRVARSGISSGQAINSFSVVVPNGSEYRLEVAQLPSSYPDLEWRELR